MAHLTIHATPADANLIIWAETLSTTNHGEGPKDMIPFHPAGATQQQLENAFKPIMNHLQNGLTRANTNVWLPTLKGKPVHSKPEKRVPNSGDQPLPIQPWAVPAVRLQHEDVATFLHHLTRSNNNLGITPGVDVIYWDMVTRFIMSLMARQCYLPNFDRESEKFLARWTPAYWPNDQHVLRQLSQLMPPAANAAQNSSHRNPIPPPASQITLERYINATVDLLAFRNAHQGAPELPQAETGTHVAGVQTIHDAWISGLTTKSNRRVGGDPESRNHILEEHLTWTMPIDATSDFPYRLVVELAPPEGPHHWRLIYRLQNRQEPNRSITTQEAWTQAQQAGNTDHQLPANVREFIVSNVVDASTFSTLIAEKLTKGEMHNIYLTTDEAHRFITQDAQPLAKAGFTVQLPPLWSQDDHRHPLSFEAQVRHVEGSINLRTLFEYDWRISLGDDPITEQELSLLAKSSEPLVKIRDRWLDIQNRKLREVIQSIARRSHHTATALQLMQMNMEPTLGLPNQFNQAIVAQGLMGRILRVSTQHEFYQLIKPPEELNGDLRTYQHRGYSWLNRLTSVSLGACLADDMGLGKTLQTLAVILQHAKQPSTEPALIICPTSVVSTWLNEAAKFTPTLRIIAHHGSNRAKTIDELAELAQTTDAFVTSYGTAYRDVDILASMSWHGLYLDEAQNIKNPRSRRARACRRLPAQHRVVITGTPVENNLNDLWALMDFANPGLLGPEQTFIERYQHPNGQTKRLAQPFILRRLKSDPELQLDLPEKIETDVHCSLTREQASLYTAVLSDLDKQLHQDEPSYKTKTIFSTITRLKQICNHPAQFLRDGNHDSNRSGKLTRLLEMLDEVFQAGDKAVIFTDFVAMARIIQDQITSQTGDTPRILHGQLSARSRDEVISQFQNDSKPKSLIVSVRAGGTGITLTAANHVFHFDRWWNPAVENQATDRINRPGQHKLVQIHTMTCAGTLEENIASIIASKRELATDAITTGDHWLRTLTGTQLRAALTLGARQQQ